MSEELNNVQSIEDYEPYEGAHSCADIDEAIDTAKDVKPKVEQSVTSGGLNMFNFLDVKYGVFLDQNTGAEVEREQYNTSDYMDAQSSKTYTIKTFTSTGSATYRIYYYTSAKAYISRTTSAISLSPNGFVFTTPATCRYIRLSLESSTNTAGTQDEKTCVLVSGNETITEYIPYYTANDATARTQVNGMKEGFKKGVFCPNLMGMEVGKFYRINVRQGEQLTITKSDGSIFPSDNTEKVHFYNAAKQQVGAASLATGLTYKTTAAMESDVSYARWMPGFGSYSTPMMVVKGTEPKEYIEYYDNPRQLREDMESTDADIYGKMSRCEALNNKLPVYLFPDVDHWEIGGINLTSEGWTYGANPNRVRTKEGYTIPIQRGDVISLSDYTNARFNVGVLKTDGTYGFTGWRTADYISTVDGYIVMVLGNLTDTPQTSVYDLMNLVSIKQNSKHKSPNANPILTIIDDDTLSVEHVTKFYNACVAKGIVGTFASEMHYVESVTGLKELLQGYEDDGFEIAFHCNLQTEIYRSDQQYRDSADMEEDFTQGLRKYRQWFLPSCCWVTPYGSHDAEIQGLAKKRGFEALVSISQKTYERVGVYSNRYFIPRVGLNQTDGEGSVTLAQLKDIMRECATDNGWLLVGTHFNEWDAQVGYSRFDEIVDLAVTLGYDIMTLSQAYRIWKPLYDERDRDAMLY